MRNYIKHNKLNYLQKGFYMTSVRSLQP